MSVLHLSVVLLPGSSFCIYLRIFFLFFFNDTATTEIYTLSLHDALPIYRALRARGTPPRESPTLSVPDALADRKSTRLNSSHGYISYAVFCLKKKKKIFPSDNSIRRHIRLYGLPSPSS